MGALDFASQPLNLTPDKPLGDPAKPAAPASTPEAKPEQKAAPQAPVDPAAGVGKGMAAADKKIDALEAQAMQLKPPQINLPPKPEPKHTSPLEMFGSYAMMFAALGGLLSRNHLTTSLNAMSAAINGYKQKDKDATDEAMKQWEAESKNALNLINFQNRAYEQALGNIRHSEDLELRRGTEAERVAKSKMDALQAAFSDPAMAEASKSGLHAMVDLQKKREDMANRLAEEKIKVSRGYAGMQAAEEYNASDEYAAATPMERLEKLASIEHEFGTLSGRSASAGKQPMTEQQKDFYADQIGSYNMAPPGQFLMRNPDWTEVMERAQKKHPDYISADFATSQKVKQDIETGADGRVLRSLTAVRQHLDYLGALAESLPNTSNMQQLNAMAASLSKQLGHREVTSFDAAKAIVGPEIIKAIVGSGAGGQAEREHAMELFSAASTPEQLKGAIQAVKVLLGGQAISIVDTQFKGTPKPILDRFLDTKAIDEYRRDLQESKKSKKDAPKGDVAKAEGPKPVEISHPQEALQVANGSSIKLPNGAVVPMSDEIREKLKKMMGQ